jgi:hypothetical protein
MSTASTPVGTPTQHSEQLAQLLRQSESAEFHDAAPASPVPGSQTAGAGAGAGRTWTAHSETASKPIPIPVAPRKRPDNPDEWTAREMKEWKAEQRGSPERRASDEAKSALSGMKTSEDREQVRVAHLGNEWRRV